MFSRAMKASLSVNPGAGGRAVYPPATYMQLFKGVVMAQIDYVPNGTEIADGVIEYLDPCSGIC